MGIADDTGDLAIGKWRQEWRLSGWGLETKVEFYCLGSGDNTRDLAARKWRPSR